MKRFGLCWHEMFSRATPSDSPSRDSAHAMSALPIRMTRSSAAQKPYRLFPTRGNGRYFAFRSLMSVFLPISSSTRTSYSGSLPPKNCLLNSGNRSRSQLSSSRCCGVLCGYSWPCEWVSTHGRRRSLRLDFRVSAQRLHVLAGAPLRSVSVAWR
jgi:hypothetical protein